MRFVAQGHLSTQLGGGHVFDPEIAIGLDKMFSVNKPWPSTHCSTQTVNRSLFHREVCGRFVNEKNHLVCARHE